MYDFYFLFLSELHLWYNKLAGGSGIVQELGN